MENNGLNSSHLAFIDIMQKAREEKERLKSTQAYTSINALVQIYLEKGKVQAYIKIPEINTEYNIPEHHYKDLIDIYFMEQSEPATELVDAKIDLIELVGSEFKQDAIDYIFTFAEKDSTTQVDALRLLVLYGQLDDKKEYINKTLKENINNFSIELQNGLLAHWDQIGYNHNSIKPKDGKTAKIETENISDTKTVNKIINKKWWEFWK